MSKLVLETLSPVHIGSGEKYSSSEFLIRNNKILKLDINKVFSLLNQNEKDDFVDSLEYPDFRLENFLQGKKISISEATLYSSNYKTGSSFKEINENIKTNFEGYIPGSSLKGAIKTAILSAFIGEKEIYQIGELFSIRDPWQRKREVEGFNEGFFSNNGKKDSYSDFMKFVQIPDFRPVKNLCVYDVQSLEAEGNNWRWYHRNGRVVQSYLETIASGERIEGEISITYDDRIFNSLKLKGKEDILELTEIKRLIHGFSDRIINHEIDFSNRYGIEFLKDFYINLKQINTKESPVIKLGHGSGYLATTIGLELKNNPAVYEKVRTSLRGKSYAFEFPKTRRIVMEEKMPLGWCRLI